VSRDFQYRPTDSLKAGECMVTFAIRKEEKAFEARTPLVPEHVGKLIIDEGIDFIIEPSDQRTFNDKEYEDVGATLSSAKGSNASVVLGLKEMPNSVFEPRKVYVFFSHTIKGQEHNMPMLRQIMNTGATLLDYELIVNDEGLRLVYFGNWAGMAGISDTLRLLGRRLEYEQIDPNPFLGLKPTLDCNGLEGLRNEFKKLGRRINELGLPQSTLPFVVGFAGYGNVSSGAQKLFDILPHKTVTPEDLGNLEPLEDTLYKCVFKEEHMFRPLDKSADFDLQDYYEKGSKAYQDRFHRYVPHITVLMNCIYWSPKYPRLLTKDFITDHWDESHRKLRIVGDISCDINGAIEFTETSTKPNKPAFTYIVKEDRILHGVKGEGPVVVAVDNLPAELPKESSYSFSQTLLPFIPPLASADYSSSYAELQLPRELKDAIIVYKGDLTNQFEYLKEHLTEEKT
jgi:alanine dehydrogenase